MKKELTVKQQTFLDHLIETGGDPKKAAKLAGYSENGHWQVVQALKNEIIELASNLLAQSAPKAAMKLVDIKQGLKKNIQEYVLKKIFGINSTKIVRDILEGICRLNKNVYTFVKQ